jgi:hypothetical protein
MINLLNVRSALLQEIVRKEGDIDSLITRVEEIKERVESRIDMPEYLEQFSDDLHKAKMKLRFEKNRVTSLRCELIEVETEITKLDYESK